MVEAFFKKINKLPEEKSKKLKQIMSENTMIGEYCGNPEYQHLVKYVEIDLQIFAFVEKKVICHVFR
jgi:hypothetical protein